MKFEYNAICIADKLNNDKNIFLFRLAINDIFLRLCRLYD